LEILHNLNAKMVRVADNTVNGFLCWGHIIKMPSATVPTARKKCGPVGQPFSTYVCCIDVIEL
jgi:hypothetical protein